MEDLQISYISALCASVGIDYDIQGHDADSTDAIIKKKIEHQHYSHPFVTICEWMILYNQIEQYRSFIQQRWV
jgi:predicted small metal-binding protein